MTRPLLAFVLLGSVLFVAHGVLRGAALRDASPAVRPRVVVGAEEVEQLRREARVRDGVELAPEALAAGIDALADEEMLVREALALGLDRRDALVQRRLLRNMRFAEAAPRRTDTALLREASALELPHSDLVVRRRLLQRVELAAREAARLREPDAAELAAARRARPADELAPARARISHVYLSRSRRGAGLEAQARALLSRLRAEGLAAERAVGLGDAFLLGHHLPLRSERELARGFGAELARAVFDLAPGAWSEPLPSSAGLHLVTVHERLPARPVPEALHRAALREAVFAERESRLLDEWLGMLRGRIEVRVEASDAGLAAGSGS